MPKRTLVALGLITTLAGVVMVGCGETSPFDVAITECSAPAGGEDLMETTLVGMTVRGDLTNRTSEPINGTIRVIVTVGNYEGSPLIAELNGLAANASVAWDASDEEVRTIYGPEVRCSVFSMTVEDPEGNTKTYLFEQ